MMGRRIRGRVVFGALVTVIALSFGGAAYAYWAGNGSGSGAALTGTTVPVTLSVGVANDALYPGAKTNVVLTASNPNVAQVRIGSIALDASKGTNGFGSNKPGCGLSALSFTAQTNGGAGWVVQGKSALEITLTNALAMSTTAGADCQGAQFTVYLVVGP